MPLSLKLSVILKLTLSQNFFAEKKKAFLTLSVLLKFSLLITATIKFPNAVQLFEQLNMCIA